MKKLNLLTVLIMLAVASVSFGQITGTAHDFSSATWSSNGEICITCHTPHNAIAGVEPLWNHTLSTATYTLYTSSTFDGSGTIGQPDGSSKLCLSCHDGTIALDNYGGNQYSGTSVYISAGNDLTTDLTNDHPVSFTYDAALVTADGGGLSDPTLLTGAVRLESSKMQCSSCHDPHGSGFGDFLVMSNAASALCLTCHIK